VKKRETGERKKAQEEIEVREEKINTVIMMASTCKGKAENRKFRIGVVNKKITVK
jgi:hypothetical protein